MARSLVGFLLVCVPLIPSGAQGGGAAEIGFVTVDKGLRSGILERRLLVITTAPEWEELWRAHRSARPRDQPPPALDASREVIVAVFLGEKRTGGYAIDVVRVEEDRADRSVKVFIRETSPPPGAMVTQALTQPYHIVRLRKVALPVVFIPLDP
jgi:hypothetical protein